MAYDGYYGYVAILPICKM